MTADRAQAHTLEAIVASLLLLGSLVFAFQVTAVTPLSASTSSQQIENEQQARAEGLLATAGEDGSLKRALLYWDDSRGEFHCAGTGSAYRGPPDCEGADVDTGHVPPNEFGAALSETFGAGVAVNVVVNYQSRANGTANGSIELNRQPLLYRGEPTDNAVRAATTVVLFDDDELLDEFENETGETVGSSGSYFAPDAHRATASGSRTYNVFRVEVTAWRI